MPTARFFLFLFFMALLFGGIGLLCAPLIEKLWRAFAEGYYKYLGWVLGVRRAKK